jgi:hypothetical protein
MARRPRRRGGRSRTSPRWRSAALLATVLAAGVAFWAVVALGPLTGSEAEGDGTPPLFAETERFVRQEVTLTGRVEQRYRKGAFALATGGGHDAVVLPARGADADVARGMVRVTGTVRRVGVDLRHILGGDTAVRRGEPALAEADVQPLEG